MKRLISSKLDKILGKKLPVLDDGFIRVIDYLGSDASIVQAARVSYGKGTKTVSTDRNLIRYLLRNNHTSPFEMCEIKLHVRVPMDVWRQWIRHRTANVNEYSTRYSIAIDSQHKTEPTQWRFQDHINKQSSVNNIPKEIGVLLTRDEIALHKLSNTTYQKRLETGVAREQARKDLPLSTYTEAYWKIDLHNLLHFLELRMNKKAQYEIRQYANIIGNDIVSKWCPYTWEAFCIYRLNSISFSTTEQDILNLIIRKMHTKAYELLINNNMIMRNRRGIVLSNEGKDFEDKLKILNLSFLKELQKV